jgi:hypothetical protein
MEPVLHSPGRKMELLPVICCSIVAALLFLGLVGLMVVLLFRQSKKKDIDEKTEE